MKNEFDNNLTDKGWQSMRRLLDREMPEQRRRRRFAWWPLALLLLPVAGAGGWWAFRPSESDKIIPPAAQKPKISEPVVKAEEKQHLPKVSNFPKVEPTLSDGSKLSGNFTTATSSVASLRLIKTPDIDETNGQKATNLSLASGENMEEHRQTSFDAATGQNGEDLVTLKKPSHLNTLPIIPQFIENETDNTPKLNPVAVFAAAPKKKHAEPKRWHFGLAAGVASENLSKISGFSIGGAVDWQFARKWGLRSGLQYAQYRLSATERPVVSLDAEKYADATGNFTILDTMGGGGGLNNPTPSVSSPEVLVPVEKLRHLEMPFMVYWQPLRPLRIFGGISTAYTLSAKASNESYANNQFYYANNATAQKNLDELTSQTLSRWNTSWQAGVGVRLGRHLEVGAFYKQGFNSLGNSSAEQLDVTNIPSDPVSSSGRSNNYFLLNGIWFF